MAKRDQKHILFVVAGIAPAIVTEAFYQLRVEGKVPVEEVWVITTGKGRQALEAELLGEEGAFKALCRDYKIAPASVKLDRDSIKAARDDSDLLIDDVIDSRDNVLFPDLMIRLVKKLTADPRNVIHACLSGGRKSMSFYLGAALMMFGRPQDQLLHVVVDKDLERCRPPFYYPTPHDSISRVEEDGEVRSLNLKHARVLLSRIPYLRLRQKLSFADESLSYREMVNLMQQDINALPQAGRDKYPGLYPESPQMREILDQCRLLPEGETALIIGETGTGKESVARYIHNITGKKEGKFFAVDMGAELPTLLASRLFGHKRGAFTGAEQDRKGVFEEAGEGTVFLDEIDKLSLESQAVLLRLLDQRQYLPLGETVYKPLKCRLIFAANRDLAALVEQGKFLTDLYYRISAFVYHVPPLKARRVDILPLARHFLKKYSEEYRKNFISMDEPLQNFLLAYTWPGNVREMENFIKPLVAYHDGVILKYEFLPERWKQKASPGQSGLDVQIIKMLEDTLSQTGGNVAAAAKLLNMKYTTLQSKLQKHGIKPASFRRQG